ncbi:UxaA family hydrolase [Silvimonas iriomotensis]|uniref:Hydrolase n=1 Tax=Silvimonas iriomotensis TaxID=449662 RepID=A0ABQ2P784_9NEIS|nr:UxaA family hydrolase [Silvimonas iriomotensis]GGP20105.1 hydrolase [Silvimonas iriomotensis]
MSKETDRRLLLIGQEDNCLIVCAPLAAGETVLVEGQSVTLPHAIAIGHKLARSALHTGDKVVRYGAIIGSATRPIAQGEHIHTHNLASDYLPTYTLEEGQSYVHH